MLERERLESKKISKTNAVTSIMDHELPAEDVHVGPSDYVPWLTDRKWAHIRVEGQAFGDVPLNVELKLEVWDSPELGGHRDRRRALLQARAQPRRRRPARRALLLPDEVAPQPAPRRPGARGHREVHRQVRRTGRDAAKPGVRARRPARERRAGAKARAARRPPRNSATAELAAGEIMADRWPSSFSIAHVTPYPWEAQENEVNAYVERVSSRALAAGPPRAGARPVALAGAGARLAQGAARRARATPREPAGGNRRGTPARDRRRRGARRRRGSAPAAGARRCRSTWRARSRNC